MDALRMTNRSAGLYQRWQRCSARCSFKRAMAMATLSASCRSSERVSLRSLMRFRIRSRASWNSLSSLACSGQLMARVEAEHIRAPVENAEEENSREANKRQTLFSPNVRSRLGATLWAVGWRGLPLMNKQRLLEFLGANRLGVLSTIGSGGEPQSALVGIAVTPEFEIVFDCVARSRKFANLQRDARAAFVIGWQGEVTVQFEGAAK